MAKVSIDQALCTHLGACKRICPEAILVRTGDESPPGIVHAELCTSCGHCAAICPSGAIAHADFAEGTINTLDAGLIPADAQVLELLRARRSLRVFKDRPVEREVVERILDAACLAPSGHNTQSTEFIVVQDATTLTKIHELTAAFYAKTAKQLHNPIVRAAMGVALGHMMESVVHFMPCMDTVVADAKEGKAPFLRNAPCLIVCHAEEIVHYPDANAMLALHNASLMCQALGLGSFLVGYVTGACDRGKSIPRLLGVPKHHKVYGALALGYPELTFKNWIQRRPPKVSWI